MILGIDGRDAQTIESDRLAEQLLGKFERKFIYPLVIFVFLWGALFFGAWDAIFFGYLPENIGILALATVIWLLWIFHYLLLGIYHELWEINDQLSGRKSEFRDLIGSLKEVE